jgi:hypothetical protein
VVVTFLPFLALWQTVAKEDKFLYFGAV